MENSDFCRNLREKILETFWFVQKFFETNNIHYIACGGTVLGAVRHGGMIPWDDDIDIYVPREDYNRLIKLNDKLNDDGYNFVCFENNDKYYLPFGKIENRNTTVLEHERFKYITGIFIDIFPLDCYAGTKDEVTLEQERYYKIFLKYQHSIDYPSIKNVITHLFNGSGGKEWKALKCYCYHPLHKYFYRKLMKEIKIASGRNGEWCVCTPQWIGRIFRTEWFINVIDAPFEGHQVKIPSDYDSYLSLLYGDYMTPPPVNQRQMQHTEYFAYINLKERLSYNDVKKRLTLGEKIVY